MIHAHTPGPDLFPVLLHLALIEDRGREASERPRKGRQEPHSEQEQGNRKPARKGE